MSNDPPIHYKSMFVGGEKESPYLYACHLAFKDLTVTIDRCAPGEVKGTGGKATGKPILFFRETGIRPLALNKTNGAQIVALYGTANVSEWKGKRLTLFPTTTQFGKDIVECIRIRPVIPAAPSGSYDLDGVLAEIAAAETPEDLAKTRAWINGLAAKPNKDQRDRIKAALDGWRARPAATIDAETGEIIDEPGAADE